MFKITEFSQLSGLTIRTLQYYDEIGLLVPLREKNGHRLYSYQDLILINEIILLKNTGLSLERITQQLKTNPKLDLKKSLQRQKNMLVNQRHVIQQQIENLEWLIQAQDQQEDLETAAIRQVFIEHNPLKEQSTAIWDFDFADPTHLEQLKNFQGRLDFDYYFSKLANLQDYPSGEEIVQTEVGHFVTYLITSYQGSLKLENLPQFAALYLENKAAINHLQQYGENFNHFLSQALTYFANNKK